MKIGPHGMNCRYVYITREHGVQRAHQLEWSPSRTDNDPRCLPKRVHTCVGSSCAENGYMGAAQPFHSFLEYSLYSSLVGLALPPREARSVILKNQLERQRFHGANYPGE